MAASTKTVIAVMDTVDDIQSRYPVNAPAEIAARVRKAYADQAMPLTEEALTEALARNMAQSPTQVAIQPEKLPIKTTQKSDKSSSVFGLGFLEIMLTCCCGMIIVAASLGRAKEKAWELSHPMLQSHMKVTTSGMTSVLYPKAISLIKMIRANNTPDHYVDIKMDNLPVGTELPVCQGPSCLTRRVNLSFAEVTKTLTEPRFDPAQLTH